MSTVVCQTLAGPTSGDHANKVMVENGHSLVDAQGNPIGRKLLNFYSVTKNDTQTHSAFQTWTEITDLSITLTPFSASSKFYITGHINLSWDAGQAKGAIDFVRDGTPPSGSIGVVAGNRIQVHSIFYTNSQGGVPFNHSINFYDSPNTTSQITYTPRFRNMDPQGIVGINYCPEIDTDSNLFARTVSTFTVMEIGA